MNNGINISYQKHQAVQASAALIATVNTQMGQAAQLDDQPGMDTSLGKGSVLAQDQDSYVQLSYDPQTQTASSFSFKAHNNIMTPDGQLLVPGGLETSMSRSDDGKLTYAQKAPDGSSQQAVVDPQSNTIQYAGETISDQDTQVSSTINAIVATVNGQINNYAGLDEQPGVDTATGVGSVRARDESSSVELDYDPATGAARHYQFEAHEDVKTPDGQTAISKGVKTSMNLSEDGIETYSQTLPMQDGGSFTQEVSVNEKTQTISYNEWVLKP